jgi:hypothetical protein
MDGQSIGLQGLEGATSIIPSQVNRGAWGEGGRYGSQVIGICLKESAIP